MLLQKRHIPHCTAEQLDHLDRPKVLAKAVSLADALGMKDMRLPATKNQLIDWILKTQERALKNAGSQGEKLLAWKGSAEEQLANTYEERNREKQRVGPRDNECSKMDTIYTGGVPGQGVHANLQRSCHGLQSSRSQSSLASTYPGTQSSVGGRVDTFKPQPGGFSPMDTARSQATYASDTPSDYAKKKELYTSSSAIYGSGKGTRPDKKPIRQSEEDAAHMQVLRLAAAENKRLMTTVQKSEKATKMLKKVIIFHLMNGASIPNVELDSLVDAFRLFKANKGDVMFREGDLLRDNEPGLYVLEEGSLCVYKDDDQTKTGAERFGRLVHELREEGGVVGDQSLFYESPRNATIVCGRDHSVIWTITRENLSKRIKDAADDRRRKLLGYMRTIPFLQRLNKDKMEQLHRAVEVTHVSQGTCVLKQGQLCNSLYLVESGSFVVCRFRDTLASHVLSRKGPGDTFGEWTLLKDTPSAADIIAETTNSRLITIPRSKLTDVIGQLSVRLDRNKVLNSTVNARSESKSTTGTDERRSSVRSAILPEFQGGNIRKEIPSAGFSKRFAPEPRTIDQPQPSLPAQSKANENDEMKYVLDVSSDTTSKLRRSDQEAFLQNLLKGGAFEPYQPTKAELMELADSLMLHRMRNGDVLLRAGEPDCRERIVCMVVNGVVDVYEKTQYATQQQCRPAKQGFGTRISLYNTPNKVIRGALLPFNDAQQMASFVCNGLRTEVLSVDNKICQKLFSKGIASRREAASDMLKKVEYFRSLTEPEFRSLVLAMGSLHFQRGDFMWQDAQMLNSMYFIESGSCKVMKNGTCMAEYQTGDHINPICALTEFLAIGDMVVTSKDLMVLTLCRSDFNRLIGTFSLEAGR